MTGITLPGTDIRTTRLGFGCARLFRLSSSQQRQRVLNAAFDSGIRHFDVARMYGMGAAEKELGQFTKGKRDQVIIATKFGIEPNASGRTVAKMQQVARAAIRTVPALRRVFRRQTNRLYHPRCYSPEFAARSLDISLRELNTDYVDILVLHEPTLEDLSNTEIIPWLQAAKSAGKIRAYGISGEFDDLVAIDSRFPELSAIVQLPCDVLNRNMERLKPRSTQAVVTFSALSRALDILRNVLHCSTQANMTWTSEFGAESLSDNWMVSALLHYCLNTNPNGVVLFSSTKEHQINNTCAVFMDSFETARFAATVSNIFAGNKCGVA